MIRVEARTYKGNDYLDIRKFFMNSQNVACPTKKGVCVKRSEMIEMIDMMGKEMTEEELSQAINKLSEREAVLFNQKAGSNAPAKDK